MAGGSLISIPEGAERLGLSTHTLRRRIAMRLIPCIRIGRRVLLDPKDLEQLIEDSRQPARSEEASP